MHDTAGPPSRSAPAGRVLLPLIGTVVLATLVFLLPGRDRPRQPLLPDGTDVHRTSPLQLDEPPGWALSRGHDAALRALDRLSWGGHDALAASRDALAAHAGGLAPELLARLSAIGGTDPALAAKYIAQLGAEDLTDPRVIETLVSRALSPRALEVQAALRLLARCDDESSLHAVLSRTGDVDVELARLAREVLLERARRGDDAALQHVLGALESDPLAAESRTVRMLGELPSGGRIEAVLRQVFDFGPPVLRVTAAISLARHGDAAATTELERLLEVGPVDLRTDVYRLARDGGLVLGRERWTASLAAGSFAEITAMFGVLTVAIDSGHAAAGEAVDLLEQVITDVRAVGRAAALSVLFQRRHPLAIEITRQELQGHVGAHLTEVVDRILLGPQDLRRELGSVGLQRLLAGDLRPADQGTLMRFVSEAVPDLAAPLLVDAALGRGPLAASSGLAAQRLGLLGEAGVAFLQSELADERAAQLFVQLAEETRSPATLGGLAHLLTGNDTPQSLRRRALDALARLRGGPRDAVLRQVLADNTDAELRERGRLVFWNYL